MIYRISAPIAVVLLLAASLSAENWPGWRGPRGDGSSLEAKTPVKWNGKTGENIVWKKELPGWGHSSPVVWNDRIFVTACIEDTGDRVLICLKTNGDILWRKTVVNAPLEKKHKLNSFASGTPVTDGKLIYVTFLQADTGSTRKRTPGDMVVAAYDFYGRQKWMVKPGRFASVHGFCSSPVLYKDMVIVNGDHDGDSYIIALKRDSGETVWKQNRPNRTRSYVTPVIREIDGRTQMIMSGSRCIISYDPQNGRQHWSIKGPTQQFVASMVYNGKLLFMTAGFPDHHILAIKPDGKGDVTGSHIVWRTTRGCSYVPSPAVSGDYFLVAADNGIATCFVASDGEVAWTRRMARHYSASLVTAGGNVFFLDDDGVTKVVKPGASLKVVAENPLGEMAYASPAISNGRIYIRGEKHLFCIGE